MASLREMGKGNGKLEAYGIDPRLITIRTGWNYRDTSTPEAQAHIAWLTESIRERGVDEPIWVENQGEDGLVLIDGECRLLALRALWDQGNEVYVPTIVFKGDEAAVLAKSMISNGALPPSQIEFGAAAERLLRYGWSQDRIAALTPPHLGLKGKKAAKYVKDAVELQQAPLAVKEAVKKGVDGVKVSPALALAATRQNRLMAGEIVKEAAGAAKKAGKTVASRPKGAGVATKARLSAEELIEKERKLADRLAELVMQFVDGDTAADWDAIGKVAKSYQKLRGA